MGGGEGPATSRVRGDEMAQRTRADQILVTYRYLRIGMALLVVVLAAGVIEQVFATSPNCWLGSISAYYYTSARAVFVACLCAIGACMIIYRGNTDREDRVLNLAGALAFVVAFVPTPLAELVVQPAPATGSGQGAVDCGRSNVPTSSQLMDAIDNNLAALLVGATVTVGVIWWFHQRETGSPTGPPASAFLLGLLLIAAWAAFVAAPDSIRDNGHLVAAVGLFAGIVLVVAMNACTAHWLDPEGRPAPARYRRIYRLILSAMVATLVILGPLALAGTFEHSLFWLESGVIVLFAAFWAVQTSELWGHTDRAEALDG